MRNFALTCAAAAALFAGPAIAAPGQAGHASVAVDPIVMAQIIIEGGRERDRDRKEVRRDRDRDRHGRWESRKRDRHARRESRRRKDHD
jgi:hypothetical protein